MGCSQMFSFTKAQRVSRLCPLHLQSQCWPNGRPPCRCFAKNGSAHHPATPSRAAWRVCESFSENGTDTNRQTHTHMRAHIYGHIYTYTRTKYMASNVESRQLNKWHFLLCFFFSWYRHNQTLCSSSTLVWVRYNEYNIPPFFFRQLFTHRCKIDQRSKTLTSLLFETIWRAMCSFATTAYKEKVHSKHF